MCLLKESMCLLKETKTDGTEKPRERKESKECKIDRKMCIRNV